MPKHGNCFFTKIKVPQLLYDIETT